MTCAATRSRAAIFGLDGKPTPGFGGFAGFRQAFDDRNKLVKQSFFGLDDEPIDVRDGGYAEVTWTYDGRGDLLEES